MEHGKPPVSTFNHGKQKQDIYIQFQKICDEFKSESVNGNVTLHFAWGAIAKIHATKVY